MSERRIEFIMNVVSLARQGVFARRRDEGGYTPVRHGFAAGDANAHIAKQECFGVYLVTGETCQIGVLDFDDHKGDFDFQDVATKAGTVADALLEMGMRPILFRSGGGRGVHIWLLFEHPQPAKAVRTLLRTALAYCGLRDGGGGLAARQVEVFPKQDSVGEDGLGNLIALPFARASCPLNPHTLTPQEDWNPSNDWARFLSPNAPEFGKPQSHSKQDKKFSALPNDIDEARSALKFIPADEYDVWIKALFALKHSFGDQGFDVWREWSKTAPEKYRGDADCHKRWEGVTPRGTLTVGTLFHLARERGWNGPSNPIIREMNARFGVLTHGNKTQIILKNGDKRREDESVLLGVQPFHDRLQTEMVEIGDSELERKKLSKAKFWFKHPLAAHYHALDFDPSLSPGHNGKVWNLWRGFPYAPAPGDWSLLQEHLFENICNASQTHFDWLLNWFAWGLQQPGGVIGTAVVLLGDPGVGKGVVANHYGALWAPHFVAVTQHAHVVGRFNAHLAARRVIFIDEGMFGGNRKEAGVLKAMVTDPYILMEQKGVDPIKMRNRTMFIVASNEDSVVPADIGDRRWMAFEVGAKRREDHAFFAHIKQQMDDGGYEAMMFDLLQRDLSKGPDPRKTIKSDALFHQIMRAAKPYVRYFHRILDEGRLPQNFVAGRRSTTALAMLEELRKLHPETSHLNDVALGKFVRDYFPTVSTRQNGRYLAQRTKYGEEYGRSTQYDFSSLRESRKEFEREMGQSVPWSNDLEDWQSDRDSDSPV